MSAPVHASMWHVFSLWTGARDFEPHLEDERLAACTLEKVKWDEPIRLMGGPHIEVTCVACVVLAETAAGNHERNICTDCREPFEPQGTPVFVRRWRKRSNEEWRSLCPQCDFWARALVGRTSRTVIANGHHYGIGTPQHEKRPPPSPYGGLGFGGARWEIAFKDGRRLVTHNLWSQGPIPARLRERPEWADNATFIPEAPFEGVAR